MPLSASEPEARLMAIVDRVGECTIAHATSERISHLGSRSVIDVTSVASEWIEPIASPADAPSMVIFTSGSTGAPKGVVRTGWQDDAGCLRVRQDYLECSRSAMFTPMNWLGGLNAFRSGLGNAFSCMLDPSAMSATDLVALLRDQRIEVIHLTPSLAETLSQSLSGDRGIDTLKKVRFLGEESRVASIEAARALGGRRVSVLATYAASEALGTVARLEFGPDDPLGSGRLPLGRFAGDYVEAVPLDDDSDLRELVVHKWVSRGYWDDVGNVADAFGVDAHGDPIWRSGDLVDVDADGLLRFVGRSDDVVKIAGKLVSPSETSSVLGECPGVRKAFVVARTLPSGKKQLIAHVEADATVDPGPIRARLVELLPEHLVPAVIVRHDTLPMTERGKVDRQQLQSLPVVAWRTDQPRQPRSHMERIVLREASIVLGVDGLGIHDDLWRFGLDSLGAIELSEVLARHLSTSLGVNDFVGATTPAEVAALLSKNEVKRASYIVDLGTSCDGPEVFIFTGGGSPVLAVRHLAARLVQNWHVYGVEQYGLQQHARPDRSVRAAARRSVADIQKIQPVGPYSLMGHSWGGLVAHEAAVILRHQGHEVAVVVLDAMNSAAALSADEKKAILESQGVPPWLIAGPLTWGGRGRRMLGRTVVRVRRFTVHRDRYWRFLRIAIRAGRRHTPRSFDGPMLVVDAAGSAASATWDGQPHLRTVRVPGSHMSIVQPPHVALLADEVHTFLSQSRASALDRSKV